MTAWALLIFACALGWVLLFRPTWIGGGRRFPGSTAAGFLLLAVGMTSPIAIAPEELPLDARDGTDVFLSVWNLWNTRHAIESGSSPYASDGIFLPGGADLSLHGTSVTYGVLSTPFQIAFGQAGPPQLFGVYSLLVIGSFALAAYFMFRLAFLLTRNREAATLAALLFAFADFRFANLGRLDVLATEWLVLVVWSWISLVRRPRPSTLLGLALSSLLLLHSSRDFTVQAVFVIGIWTLFDLVTGRTFRPPATPVQDRSRDIFGGSLLLANRVGVGDPPMFGEAAAKDSRTFDGAVPIGGEAGGGGRGGGAGSAGAGSRGDGSGGTGSAGAGSAGAGSAGTGSAGAGSAGAGSAGGFGTGGGGGVVGGPGATSFPVGEAAGSPGGDATSGETLSQSVAAGDRGRARDRARGRGGPRWARPRGIRLAGNIAWPMSILLGLALAIAGSYSWASSALGRLRWTQSANLGLAEESSADLVEFVLPSPNHTFWGDLAAGWVESLHFGDDRFGQSLGPLASILFVVAASWILRRRSGVRWAAMTFFFLLMTLGPALQINGRTTSVTLPYDGLASLFPWIAELGVPATWMASASLCLAVCVALGWAHARASLRWRGAEFLAIVVLLFSLSAPLRLDREPIPEAYTYIARISRNTNLQAAGLLHLPGMFPRASLLYQTVHGQNIVENVGYASRGFRGSNEISLDPAYQNMVKNFGRYRTVASLSSGSRERVRVETNLFLQRHSIRWIVVPKSAETHAWAVGGVFSAQTLGSGLYNNYCENLRALNPVSEVEIGAFTVFRF